MDFVRCNVCHVCPSAANKATLAFYFSSCGHLFCAKCLKKGNVSSANFNGFICRVCNKSASVLEINREMRPELQMYFRSARDLTTQYMQNLRSVMDFQSHHRSRLQKYTQAKLSKALQCANGSQETLSRRLELEKCINDERKKYKSELELQSSRIKTLKAMIVEKDRELKQLTRQGLASDSTDSFSVLAGQNTRPEHFTTPNNSTADRSLSSNGSAASNLLSCYETPQKSILRKPVQDHSSTFSMGRSEMRNDASSKPTYSSKQSSRIVKSSPVFKTSFDGFKVPKQIPLNSPRAFSSGSGLSLRGSGNLSPAFAPGNGLPKPVMLATYNSGMSNASSSSTSSRNSDARSALMPGRVTKGNVIPAFRKG